MRKNRTLMAFVYTSLPFVILAGALFLLGTQQTGPWDRLGYYYFGTVVLMAWAGVAFLYCVFLVLTRGLTTPTGMAAAVVVLAVVVTAGIWGWNRYQERSHCDATLAFYQELATVDLDARAALIGDHQTVIRQPTRCTYEALFYAFGHDMFEPDARSAEQEADRLTTFDMLMENGQEPTDDMLWHAANDADATLFARLVARRVAITQNGDDSLGPLPPVLAFNTVNQIDMDPDSPYNIQASAYHAILESMLSAGTDLCTRDSFGKTLAERMAAKGLITPDDLPNCG